MFPGDKWTSRNKSGPPYFTWLKLYMVWCAQKLALIEDIWIGYSGITASIILHLLRAKLATYLFVLF